VDLLDRAVLDELRVLGEDDLRDLVELYYTDVVAQLASIREALVEGDAEGVGAGAHRIKGASLSIGAAHVAGIASELETAGKAGELSGAPELIASLERDLEPTLAALNSEFSLEQTD
jgi:HPt (histidine-containing phosphotransfer) domain-containing protein